MSRASELADKLKAAAADPMWAGHCEISKRTCDFAALELERLERVNAELVEVLQKALSLSASRWLFHNNALYECARAALTSATKETK